MHRYIFSWPHLPLQLLPPFSALWESHLCLLPAVPLLSLFKPCLITFASITPQKTTPVRFTNDLHIAIYDGQISVLILIYQQHFIWLIVPSPLKKMSSLIFWNITLLGSLLAHLRSFTLECPREQSLDLSSSLFLNPWWNHSHGDNPQLIVPSPECCTHIFNHLLNTFP